MNFDDGILYEHNIEAYKKLIEAIERKGKACAIHTTGTGKMYIALKWLLDNRGESFAYVAPTNVILDKFIDIIIEQCFGDKKEELYGIANFDERVRTIEKLLGNNIHLITYSGLSRIKDANEYLKVDNIVLDEFHHCGADIWGEAVDGFLKENKNAKVLGLSATPLRNDGIDMVDVLFDGIKDSEISLKNALEKGILPVPVFIGAIYSFKEQLEEYEKKLKNRKFSKETREKIDNYIKEAKRMIEEAGGLQEVFEIALNQLQNPDNAKFIVFCSDMDDKDKKMSECKTWFGKDKTVKISSVDYSKSKKENLRTIQEFEEDKSEGIKLLFSIDMIAEGLHISDIDGVIMMRPTSSSLVFSQQLGRALSSGNQKNSTPIILDLVNNVEVLDQNLEEAMELIKDYNGRVYGRDYFKDVLSFSIQARMLDIMDFLGSISYTFEERIAPLRSYYKEMGTIGNIEIDTRYYYNGEYINIGILVSDLRRSYKLREMNQEKLEELKKLGKIRRSVLTDEQVKTLEEMGMIWESNGFMERIAPLLDYYEKKGSIDKIEKREEFEYKGEKVKIGGLISRLRKAYALANMSSKELAEYRKTHPSTVTPLTQSQIETLEKIGMVWSVERTFEERIAPLVAYYKENNTIENITGSTIYVYEGEEINLGELVFRLRRAYKLREKREKDSKDLTPLGDKQVEILEKMGIVWNVERTFEKRIAPLIAYYKEKGTIANIKTGSENYTFDGKIVNIGNLIQHLRIQYTLRGLSEEEYEEYKKQKKGKAARPLNDEEVKLLESMGMVWRLNDFSSRIAPLVAYYEGKGTIGDIQKDVVYEYNGKKFKLNNIIAGLRESYKLRGLDEEELAILKKEKKTTNNPLNDEQVEILEKMGMVWEPRGFMTRIAPLIAYYKEKGTISDIKQDDEYEYNGEQVKIGYLVSRLKKAYNLRSKEKKENKDVTPLTNEEVKILESMGIVWNVKQTFSDRIAPLVAYYKENGTIANIKSGSEEYVFEGKVVNVGKLIVNLRTQYASRNLSQEELDKKGRIRPLTDEEVKILESIGMVWSTKKPFKDVIAPLVAYYKEYGSLKNIKVRDEYEYNGEIVKIGDLISRLRYSYKYRTANDSSKNGAKQNKYRPLTDEEVAILESMGMEWSSGIASNNRKKK